MKDDKIAKKDKDLYPIQEFFGNQAFNESLNIGLQDINYTDDGMIQSTTYIQRENGMNKYDPDEKEKFYPLDFNLNDAVIKEKKLKL